jgi:predicted nuclease of predicted toxin-antitoxin system
MKILVDMNLAPAWIPVLEKAGFEARHWSTIGQGNAPDAQLFDWARRHGYIIFTHDLDFGSVLALTQAASPSVFQVRTIDVTPATLGARVIALLNRFKSELQEGALVVADEQRERVRLLPFGAG